MGRTPISFAGINMINLGSINPDGFRKTDRTAPNFSDPFPKTWSEPLVFEKMVSDPVAGFYLSVPDFGAGEVTATSRQGCHH